MSGRPAIRRWLIFLGMTGSLTLLFGILLHPVVVPWIEFGGHIGTLLEGVAFRPIWATKEAPTARDWLVVQAVLALTIGAWTAFFWPLPTDRR